MSVRNVSIVLNGHAARIFLITFAYVIQNLKDADMPNNESQEQWLDKKWSQMFQHIETKDRQIMFLCLKQIIAEAERRKVKEIKKKIKEHFSWEPYAYIPELLSLDCLKDE